MSTMTFGRVGLAAGGGGSGEVMLAPRSIDADGDTVTLEGLQHGMTREDLLSWREQMIAYHPDVNDGEPAIPVTFADAPELDGWFVPVDVSVAVPPASIGTAAAPGFLSLEWSSTLRRVRHSQLAQLESRAAFGLLSNSHSITTADFMVAVPFARSWSLEASGLRDPAEGAGLLRYARIAGGSAGVQLHRWQQAPAGAMVGSARVETAVGANWRVVVGRRSWDNPTGFRMSNGLVRVRVLDVFGSPVYYDAPIVCNWWNGASWSADQMFHVWASSGSPPPEWTTRSAAVLRNSPEECTVRLVGGMHVDSFRLATLDLTVRRGSRWVTVVARRATAEQLQLSTKSTTAAASTAITGGVRRSANDSSGNRFILTGAASTVFGTAAGQVGMSGTATVEVFGVGCEVGGSGASGHNSAASQILEFYRPVSETVRAGEF